MSLKQTKEDGAAAPPYSALLRSQAGVGQGVGEAANQLGLVRVVPGPVLDGHLQSDVLLVAQRDHRQAILPAQTQQSTAC